MKRIGAVTLALVGALSLGSSVAQTRQTIKIATLSPLSGPQSNLGTNIRNGAQLALNEYRQRYAALGFN